MSQGQKGNDDADAFFPCKAYIQSNKGGKNKLRESFRHIFSQFQLLDQREAFGPNDGLEVGVIHFDLDFSIFHRAAIGSVWRQQEDDMHE